MSLKSEISKLKTAIAEKLNSLRKWVENSSNVLIGSEDDYIKKTELLSPSTNGISVHSPTSGSINIEYNLDNGKGLKNTLKKEVNDLFRLNNASIGDFVGFNYKTPILAGSFVIGSIPNVYTTTLGDKLLFNIQGTGFYFHHLVATSGGVWRFRITGTNFTQDVSTYGSSTAAVYTKVFGELVEGFYNVEAEFIGEDPQHPVGTPRGWVRYNPDSPMTFNETKFKDGTVDPESDVRLINPIVEFAIQAKRSDDPNAYEKQWVPAHTPDPSATARNIIPTIYIDGQQYVFSDTTELPTVLNAKSIKFQQSYVAYNYLDTDGNYPLWDGILTHTFENGKISISHNMKLNYTSVDMGKMFHSLTGVVMSNINRLKYAGDNYYLSTPTSETVAQNTGKFSKSFIFIGSENYFVAARVSFIDALGANRNNFKDDSLEMIINQRPDGVAKIYYQHIDSFTTIPAGTEYNSLTEYHINKLNSNTL